MVVYTMRSNRLKIFVHYILPKQTLTLLAGLLANISSRKIKNRLIRYFIQTYDVNMSEALDENPEDYATFNAFFIRHLRPDCRPIANADIISPVDGCVSEIGAIKSSMLIQAKGHSYSVQELLACKKEQSDLFEEGRFATLYLSPKDYHRVHMPIDAVLKEMIYVPGKLFSVQPATAQSIPNLFARNERLVVFFETALGPMAMVLVGATIVGAIGTSWHGDIARSSEPHHFKYPNDAHDPCALSKAAEMGYFKLGSTVILLFADSARMQWQHTIHSGDSIRFGEALGAAL